MTTTQIKKAAWFIALIASAQDPADTLEQARGKILAKAAHLPNLVCVETIDRSYFSRRDPPDPPPSCERIALDRKRGRNKLQLDATDRVRVAVSFTQEREIYSWPGTAAVSYSVEDILNPGPIGTGAFAGYLLDIFRSPTVRFRLLEEKPDSLEYGFRVPIDSSHYYVAARGQWVETGYSGSLQIHRESQDIDRFTVETNELPPETRGCEVSSVLEFGSREGWQVPASTTTHHVLRDTSETESVTKISDCHEPPAALRTSSPGAPLPAGIALSMVFNTDIDSDLAAAGDTISATITAAHMERNKAADFSWLRGATVSGRIARLEHRMGSSKQPAHFVISIAFETVNVKGAVSPFYATLVVRPPFGNPVPEKSSTPPPAGHGRRDWSATFMLPSRAPRYVLRAQLESKWITVTAPAAPSPRD